VFMTTAFPDHGFYDVVLNLKPFIPTRCLGAGSSRITGKIQADSKGLSGVMITLRGSNECIETTMTAPNGRYAFRPLAAGTYSVTPSKTECRFTPSSREVTIAGRGARASFVGACP